MNRTKPIQNKKESMIPIKSSRVDPPRLLLAEDDVEMRKMLSWSLQKMGYEVVECQNGNSLMKHLRLMDTARDLQSIDLIISDIRMPGFTGFQVLESAKKLGDFPPMILMTAFPDEESREKARQLGAIAMYEKPFNVDNLIERIKQIVPIPPSSVMLHDQSPEKKRIQLKFPLDAVYRHDSASEPIKAFVIDMAAKLNRFRRHIINCRVVIDELDSDQRKKHRYHVNINVVTSGNTVVVNYDSDEGIGHENLYFAIRIAFATASRKLKHHLRKRRQNKAHLHRRGRKSRLAFQEIDEEEE